MGTEFKKVNIEELASLLKSISHLRFGVGVHSAGLKKPTIEEREQVADEILEKGLEMNHGYSSILGHVQSIGTDYDLSNLSNLQVINHMVSSTMTGIEHSHNECKVIVAIPEVLTDDSGSRLALGFPDSPTDYFDEREEISSMKSMLDPTYKKEPHRLSLAELYKDSGMSKQNLENRFHSGSKAYNASTITDLLCQKFGYIPKEFILGYVDQNGRIVVNPEFYAFLDKEKQQELFERISLEIKELSDRLINIDAQNLEATIDIFAKRFGDMDRLHTVQFVKSIISENKRIDAENGISPNISSRGENHHQESNSTENNSKEVEEEKKAEFEKKLFRIYELTYKRSLGFRKFDADFAKSNGEELAKVIGSLRIDEFALVDEKNTASILQSLETMKELPNDIAASAILRKQLDASLESNDDKNRGRRRILFETKREENQKVNEQLKNCVGIYLLCGGTDIYSEFRDTIAKMNAKGINPNIGQIVIQIGELLLSRLEKLSQNPTQNKSAILLLKKQLQYIYAASMSIDNRQYNKEISDKFEEGLLSLGVIDEKDKEQVNNTDNPTIKDAVNMFLNSGSVPLGFVEKDGMIREKTPIERQADEARRKMNEERERKNGEKQPRRFRMTISGQTVEDRSDGR